MWTKLQPNAMKQKQYCTTCYIHVNAKYADWSKYWGFICINCLLLQHDKQKSTSTQKLQDWIIAVDLVNVYNNITSILVDWVKNHNQNILL